MAVYELKPTPDKYSFLFTANAEPLLHIHSGDTVIFHTEDALLSRIYSRDQRWSEAMAGVAMTNPQTGPVYIEEAEIGDVLKVTIENIEFDRNWGVSIMNSLTSSPWEMIPSLTWKPVEEKPYIWKLTDDGKNFYEESLGVVLPVAPFMGTFGVAPALESVNTLKMGPYGGNMDCEAIAAGNTVYIPVFNKGAFFSTGDCHGRQGNGELNGTAVEIQGKATMKFEVIKQKFIRGIRIENDEYIMCQFGANPMENASRMAIRNLIDWIVEDYGFNHLDAFELLTQCLEQKVCVSCDCRDVGCQASILASVKKK